MDQVQLMEVNRSGGQTHNPGVKVMFKKIDNVTIGYQEFGFLGTLPIT